MFTIRKETAEDICMYALAVWVVCGIGGLCAMLDGASFAAWVMVAVSTAMTLVAVSADCACNRCEGVGCELESFVEASRRRVDVMRVRSVGVGEGKLCEAVAIAADGTLAELSVPVNRVVVDAEPDAMWIDEVIYECLYSHPNGTVLFTIRDETVTETVRELHVSKDALVM